MQGVPEKLSLVTMLRQR